MKFKSTFYIDVSVKNFLDPNSVPSSLDGCVVMDPMRSFKWAGANCDEALFRALCYKRLVPGRFAISAAPQLLVFSLA